MAVHGPDPFRAVTLITEAEDRGGREPDPDCLREAPAVVPFARLLAEHITRHRTAS
ncbi:hypothetical protein ABZ397_17880 [Streptomyces sp. NPDC005876]|uniref:hypothetical protein n=1 Tax=Streptomyces sp. NPDC005876 TaxID=3157076 RepID=UPI0033CA988D